MMSRAAQAHLAGHMRPAGRVFETPGLDNVFLDWLKEIIVEKDTLFLQ